MGARFGVVATAGHVDHGKSSLIVALTGIDPDRFAEEKRRGLTIDLGYAWTTLASGHEIGFVDVPGHERFVRNMLAGVGPVRLVLFVVAADEGWKPQSEEHLQILDVLGVHGGVVALTKRDLVDDETLEIAENEVREQLAGSVLEPAPVVAVSSRTGQGLDDLRAALDTVVLAAPEPETGRARLHVDRAFSIKGAGTVVTGTLQGDCLALGDEVELYPGGNRARIRSLQTHKRQEDRACPVSRVAANLVGVDRADLVRGEVAGFPGAWPTTTEFDAQLRTVRGLPHPVGARGAYTVHAGAAETSARLRFYGGGKLEPDGTAFVRVRTEDPLVLDVFDRFVLREEGRRETVGGGIVLDVAPPRRGGPDRVVALATRAVARREELAGLLAAERGALPAADVELLVGAPAPPELLAGDWCVSPLLQAAIGRAVTADLGAFHEASPLEDGAPLERVRRVVAARLRSARVPVDPSLIEALLARLTATDTIARQEAVLRLPSHEVALDSRSDEVERLLGAVSGEHEAMPPTINDLVAAGFDRGVIEAAARAGVVVRLSPELVVAPSLIDKAERAIVAAAETGLTVSGLRQALGTSRKYAVPLVEWLDRTGKSRRENDLRFPPRS